MKNNFKIFLSYSWKNSPDADIIDKDFAALDIQLTRDIRELPYGQNIKEFTETILQHDYILCLISNDFLISRNCMLEMMVLLSDKEKKVKILPVMQDNAPDIFKIDERSIYYNHWENECSIAYRRNQQLANEDSVNELKLTRSIRDNVDTFFELLIERNTQRLGKLRAKGYHELLNVIDYEDPLVPDRAWAIWKMTNPDERLRQINSFLNWHRGTINGLFYLPWFNQNLGNYNAAYEQYCTFLNKYVHRDTPKKATAYFNMALMMANYFKDYKKAEEYYRAVLQLNPNDTGAYFNLALILESNLNNYPQAIQCYQEILKLDPQDASAYINLGCIYSNRFEDYKTAAIYFENALKVDPQNRTARENLKFVGKKNSWLNKLLE